MFAFAHRLGLRVAAVAAAVAVVSTTPAAASVIPYGAPGMENPAAVTLTAPASGDVMAYFYAYEAAYYETIGLMVNGVPTGVFGLQNHSSAYGQSLNLGYANAGDTLVFMLKISTTGETFYSSKPLNFDGFNHAYATAFAGDSLIPAGTYIGFEDLRGGGDRDYNDLQFVFQVASAVPEPSTWAMMLTGLAALGWLGARRRRPLDSAPRSA